MNTILTEAEYRRAIGKTAGHAYLFFGEEDYLKAHAVRATREAICPDPAFAVFNDLTIDALDYSADRLLDAISPPPMMTDCRLVVVRGLDFGALKKDELDALTETLSLLSEYDYNTVILHAAAGMIDEGHLPKRPSAVFKKLAEVLTPVRFEASTEARLAAWAAKHFAHYGVSAGAEDCAFLITYVGKSMFVLASEIEKLAYFVLAAGRTALTAEDIRRVAVPAVECDTFALSNAVLAARYGEALDALSVMKFERVEPTVVLGDLSRTLSDMQSVRTLLDAGKSTAEIAAALKLHEYKTGLLVRAVRNVPPARLARAVSLATAADLSLKRSSADYAAIERLVCSL